MRVGEIESRISDIKSKLNTYQELLEFWQGKLELALKAEIKEEEFDSAYLIETINQLVTAFYDKPIDIIDKKREKEYVYGRHFYCAYVKEHYVTTLTSIGKTLNRNHATVIHSIREHENLLKANDYEYLKLVEHINKYLK